MALVTLGSAMVRDLPQKECYETVFAPKRMLRNCFVLMIPDRKEPYLDRDHSRANANPSRWGSDPIQHGERAVRKGFVRSVRNGACPPARRVHAAIEVRPSIAWNKNERTNERNGNRVVGARAGPTPWRQGPSSCSGADGRTGRHQICHWSSSGDRPHSPGPSQWWPNRTPVRI
jgi:hypothetical protein